MTSSVGTDEARRGPPVADRPGVVMFVATLCLTAGVLPGFLTGALGGDIGDELGFGGAGLGFALAAAYALPAVASVHAGELSDRIGPRRALMMAMGFNLFGYIAIALLAHSLAVLAVCLFVTSAGHTLAGPATKVLIARQVPEARHGFAFGLQMAAIPLASLLAGLAVPSIGETIGWRWAFVVGAALPLAAMMLLPRERNPQDPPDRERRFGHVHLGPLFGFGAAAALASAAATSTATFFIVAADEVGYDTGTAGVLLSVISGVVIFFRVSLGVIADRAPRGHVLGVAMLLAGSTIGYLLLTTGSKGAFPWGGLIALALGWSWPGVMVFALVRAHPQAPGVASAFVVGGMNVGAVAGPLAFGVLSDTTSAPSAFVMPAILAAGASLTCVAAYLRMRATRVE